MSVRRPRAHAAIVLLVVLAACSSGSDGQLTGNEQASEQTSDASAAGDESDDRGAPEPDGSQVSDSSTQSTTSTTIPEVLPLPPAADAETVTYVLPSGSFDQPLLDGPTEVDEDRCRIPQLPSSYRGGEGYTGFPVTFDNLRPDQNVRIQTIPVDWPDYEGDPDDLAGENEQVQIFMDYFETASQGALSFSPTFADKWYRLPESVSSYPQPKVSDFNPKLAQAGINAADDDIDFSLVDLVIFIFPYRSPILAGTPLSPYEHASIQHFNQTTPSDPRWIGSDEGFVRNYIGGGRYFDHRQRPVWSYYVHEAAHLFAMPDWYMKEASALLGSWQDLGLDYSVGPLNVWGVMSNQDGPSRTFVAWTRWLLNWLNDDQVDCYNVDQILDHGAFDTELVALDVYEPGTKAIIVRTGKHSGFLVESRRPVFPDHELVLWEKAGRDPYGLIVYEIDTTKGSARGTLAVVTPDGHDVFYLRTTRRQENFKVDALFNVGDRATVQGIQIELLHAGDRDVVRLAPID